MKINVTLLNGMLADRFGKYASEADQLNDFPVRSFPIQIQDLPTGTKALALTLIDYDAVPVAGFPWIHWIATDLDVTTEIPEDISRLNQGIVQGKNSADSRYVEIDDPAIINRYFGPTPPADHDYTLTVFALKEKTGLTEGFYLNDLMRKIDELVLDQATIKIPSRG